MNGKRILPILEVDGVLVSPELLTEYFCCNLEACHGACCVEGNEGAPVTIDEIAKMEENLDLVWNKLSASAQAVIDRQGVAYTDREGDLVTSIVNGKDCVFTCHEQGCCFCTFDQAFRQGNSKWQKPISCALYPIREKKLRNGQSALNYNQWDICAPARQLGRRLQLPVYVFLRDPLVRRFGEEWYAELCNMAEELRAQGYL